MSFHAGHVTRTRALRTAAAAGLLVLAVVALQAQRAAADLPACSAVTSDGASFGTLQEALDAVSTGGRVTVRGLCPGSATIARDVQIRGRGGATLDGSSSLDPVLTITGGAAVRIQSLTVANGSFSGGIVNADGTLTLEGTTVTGNSRGLYNAGTATLGRGTSIDHNAGVTAGGGVFNTGTLTLEGNAAVHENDASGGGGGGIANSGNLRLAGSSSVWGNGADAGGGLWNMTGGATVLAGRASITGNRASFGGGGIANDGILSLGDRSKVTGNTASASGGGIANSTTGTVQMSGRASVSGNVPDDCFAC